MTAQLRGLPARAALLVVLLTGFVNTGRAEVSDKHRDVAQKVFDGLIEAMGQMDLPEGTIAAWDQWPPKLVVVDSEVINAMAGPDDEAFRENRLVPTVWVHTGLIERMEYDPLRLAYVLGHEIGHLVHQHFQKGRKAREAIGAEELAKIRVAEYAVSREQEHEADFFGLQIVLKAGYSYRDVVHAMETMQEVTPHCSIPAMAGTHPSWRERMEPVAENEAQQILWRSMSAFETGVFFLRAEQYANAERCFKQVVKDFPNCWEGWANLGYAQLMQYCDGLTEEDLRYFNVGQIVVGAFYSRPDSIAGNLRGGIDAELWQAAVGALQRAQIINETLGLGNDLILVKANLGVAYLLAPTGTDVGQASRWFGEVAQSLEDDNITSKLDPLVLASLRLNAWVAIQQTSPTDSQQALDEVELAIRQARQQGGGSTAAQIESARDYTQAFALAASTDADDQQSALAKLEAYLRQSSPASTWWNLAYDRYVKLAGDLGVEPVPEAKLKTRSSQHWRPVTGVTTNDGHTIDLGQRLRDVMNELGEPDLVQTVIPGTNLKRYVFKRYGITILASRQVVAITLSGENAPTITLRRQGLVTEPVELTIGVTRDELNELFGDDSYGGGYIDDPTRVYRTYDELGIAVHIPPSEDRATEVVVVVPARAGSAL